jgi:hypothetical protein
MKTLYFTVGNIPIISHNVQGHIPNLKKLVEVYSKDNKFTDTMQAMTGRYQDTKIVKYLRTILSLGYYTFTDENYDCLEKIISLAHNLNINLSALDSNNIKNVKCYNLTYRHCFSVLENEMNVVIFKNNSYEQMEILNDELKSIYELNTITIIKQYFESPEINDLTKFVRHADKQNQDFFLNMVNTVTVLEKNSINIYKVAKHRDALLYLILNLFRGRNSAMMVKFIHYLSIKPHRNFIHSLMHLNDVALEHFKSVILSKLEEIITSDNEIIDSGVTSEMIWSCFKKFSEKIISDEGIYCSSIILHNIITNYIDLFLSMVITVNANNLVVSNIISLISPERIGNKSVIETWKKNGKFGIQPNYYDKEHKEQITTFLILYRNHKFDTKNLDIPEKILNNFNEALGIVPGYLTKRAIR